MQKISFRNVIAQCGVGLLVIFLAFIGSFLIREARSFVNPGSGPGASGVLGPDVGVIGNPTDGITGADTLFKGQKAIKDAVGAGGGGKVYQSLISKTMFGSATGVANADAICKSDFGNDFYFASWNSWVSNTTPDSFANSVIAVNNSGCDNWTSNTAFAYKSVLRRETGEWVYHASDPAFPCNSGTALACTNR